MSSEEEEKVRLNTDIRKALKTRFVMFCVKENLKIYEATEMAIELFLDEHEGQS